MQTCCATRSFQFMNAGQVSDWQNFDYSTELSLKVFLHFHICWFGSLRVEQKRSLNRMVKVGTPLSSLTDLHKKQLLHKVQSILSDTSQPLHSEFHVLPYQCLFRQPSPPQKKMLTLLGVSQSLTTLSECYLQIKWTPRNRRCMCGTCTALIL